MLLDWTIRIKSTWALPLSSNSYSFSTDPNPISTQQLEILRIRKSNQTHPRSGRSPIKQLLYLCSRLDRLNPWINSEIFMLSIATNSFTINNRSKVVNRVHSFYTLRLPYYIISTSSGTSPSFMRATKIKLDTDTGYNVIQQSPFLLGWKRHVCLDFKIPPVGYANKSLSQILSVVILRIRAEGAVFKTFFFVADFFNAEVLIGSQSMNCHVSSIRSINWQVESTKGKTPLLESAPNEPTVGDL